MKMCVITDSLLLNSSATAAAASPSAELSASTSWTQMFRKPIKPRLPRKIVTSARTNLNKYWNKFEEMMASDSITPNAATSNIEPFGLYQQQQQHSAGSTRTSFRLMAPMLRQRQRQSPYGVPPSPPASPLEPNAPQQLPVAATSNIGEQIQQLMAKRFTVERNVARSSMYKHFTDESLYAGVDLDGPGPAGCSCASDTDSGHDSDSEDSTDSTDGAPKFAFTHRNLSLSFEDKENLENEAMEVYTNLGYETSF